MSVALKKNRSLFHPPIPLLVYAAILILLSGVCSADTVRIGLVQHFKQAKQVSINAECELKASDAGGELLLTLPADESAALTPSDDGIKVTRANGTTGSLGNLIRLQIVDPSCRISVSSPSGFTSKYRGVIEVRLSDDKGLTLINEVDMEDYLQSVVPSEMPYGFCSEALKAQAVAARTFAIANEEKHAKLGYGLCDTVCCQVYAGAGGEKDSTTAAVLATKGMILTYNGQPIEAFYSADCGGYTKNAVDIHKNDIPYLKAVSDKPAPDLPDFCSLSSVHNWSKSYEPVKFEHLLNAAGVKISKIKSIEIIETDPSGRVDNIKISSETGDSVPVSGSKIRRALGQNDIKSSMFTVHIDETNGNFVFEGKGWGHGIGLCQFGANGMAKQPYGYTFDRILEHYYPGSVLQGALAPSENQVTASANDTSDANVDKEPQPAKRKHRFLIWHY